MGWGDSALLQDLREDRGRSLVQRSALCSAQWTLRATRPAREGRDGHSPMAAAELMRPVDVRLCCGVG